jgi:hypothetical protein
VNRTHYFKINIRHDKEKNKKLWLKSIDLITYLDIFK